MKTAGSARREAAIAAVRFVEIFGFSPLIRILKRFGVQRIDELDEKSVPAFVAQVWIGPRIRRVK
ncbi:MAG: hypothetical protein P8079_02015 [Gammaproteobacteria bacterium]|jgi:hypothetical protein